MQILKKKEMKKIQKLILLALTVALILPACKKGENDPFLSFRSRKSRVAGEWTVDFKEEVRKTTKIEPSVHGSSTETTTISGSTYTNTFVDASGTDTDNGTVRTFTYTYEKDGGWSSVYEFTVITILGSGTFATTQTTVTKIECSGVWNFLGKIGDAKNKENMSVSTTSKKTTTVTTTDNSFTGTDVTTETVTQSFAENENVEIWKLTQLKNKELKAEIELDMSSVKTSTSSGSETNKIVYTELLF